MAINKMPIASFVDGLYSAYKRKDGYIMGSTGQNPKKWAKTSWWFTQYDKNDKQKAKALYWREHAARVWDCCGLAEGLYKDYSGVDINTKARYAYSNWCNPKGAGMIPANKRVAGAAVFWGDNGKPSTIHHIAYLYKPVSASDPSGDWYIIEARGVMYGVVMTKLNSRKPNFWGHMTKYFEYEKAKITIEVPKQEEPKEPVTSVISGDYIEVRHGSYYLRVEPNTNAKSIHVTRTGDKLKYLGVVVNGWYKVEYDGKECYVSSKCGDIIKEKTVASTKVVIAKGTWNIRAESNAKAKILGYAKAGQSYEATGKEENNWVEIFYNDGKAWISKSGIAK